MADLYAGDGPIDEHAALVELVKLARDVRAAQRDYFKTRTDPGLQRSKELERRLDRMLADPGLPEK